jgi:NAD(P)H dehydrogenase (quinone)
MRIIVTGAGGRLGRLVAAALLELVAPADVVLVTRRPEGLLDFRSRGADVRYGDFDNPASLADAFAGAERMLLISSDALGRRVRQHRAAIDAATAAGVAHVVFTSIVNPVRWNPTGDIAWEVGRTELLLHRSDLAWTVLRFGSFAELQVPPAATAIQNRQLVLNFGKGRIVPISRRDCAHAAAVTLTTEGHLGKTYHITGAESFSQEDLAELFSELSAQRVRLVPLTDAMLTSLLVGIGTPATSAWSITAYGRAVRQGYFDVIDPTFERLTGVRPVPLRDVLMAHHPELLAVR